MVPVIDQNQVTSTAARSGATDANEIFAGIDAVAEGVAELQSLDGTSKTQPNGSLERFRPNGIIRLTKAARSGYADLRSSVERLLHSEGFLQQLSPLQQRRKVWEAWKHTHGFGFLDHSQDSPHGLEADAASLIESAEHIPKSRVSNHRDVRAQEAVDCVDQLFETDCCLRRARLLQTIALTFDGIVMTSLRRQLVDVLGAHLIGLDDRPAVSYTGRRLTSQEQIAAAAAIRRTCSPHAFYYLEKFVEDSGRSYQYSVDGTVKHRQTTAVVRAAVVRAVEGMLDDVDRSSQYSSRTDTRKLRQYATDIGRLRRRLAELNRHLFSDTDFALTLERPLPLPSSAGRYSLPARRLWRELTTLSAERLTALSNLLERRGSPANPPPKEIGYLPGTQQLLDRMLLISEDHWPDVQQQIAATTVLRPMEAAISRYREENSALLNSSGFVRSAAVDDRRKLHFGGRAQEAELADLRSHAEYLLTHAQNVHAPNVMSQEQAVDAIAQVLRRRRAVPDPAAAYLSERAGRRRRTASGEGTVAVAKLRDRVERAGGPAMYYQVSCRQENDPNRLLFELALALLAVVAQAPSPVIKSAAVKRAQRHLLEFDARGIAALLERWCDLSSAHRVRVEDGQKLRALLVEFGSRATP